MAVGIKQSNSVYRMFIRTKIAKYEGNAVAVKLKTRHERMGHLHDRALRNITSKGIVEGAVVSDDKEFFCESCQFGKAHKTPFKKEVHRNSKPGEVIHTDVCGPMENTSLGGARYFLTFKDDATGYRRVFFLKHKSDVFDQFVIFEREVNNKFGRPMKVLRSDNGTEYVNERMKKHLQALGIKQELTAPYTPEQNGKAECNNRTIVECARTLLCAKDLPGYLWAEAVNTAVYILNRVSTSTNDRSKTAYELWEKKKPNLSHLRVFGSTAYQYEPKQLTTKFHSRSTKKILVGYQENSSNYKLFDPHTRKVTVAKHVTFNEGHQKEAVVRLVPDEDILVQVDEPADAADVEEGAAENYEVEERAAEEDVPRIADRGGARRAITPPRPRVLRDRNL